MSGHWPPRFEELVAQLPHLLKICSRVRPTSLASARPCLRSAASTSSPRAAVLCTSAAHATAVDGSPTTRVRARARTRPPSRSISHGANWTKEVSERWARAQRWQRTVPSARSSRWRSSAYGEWSSDSSDLVLEGVELRGRRCAFVPWWLITAQRAADGLAMKTGASRDLLDRDLLREAQPANLGPLPHALTSFVPTRTSPSQAGRLRRTRSGSGANLVCPTCGSSA